MSERSKRRAFDRGMRRLAERANAAGGPPDTCPMCGKEHHTELAPALATPAADGRTPPMAHPVVKDALWHVTVASFSALSTAHNTEAALELMPEIANALGWLMGAVESFGAVHGVERFFDAGPGAGLRHLRARDRPQHAHGYSAELNERRPRMAGQHAGGRRWA